MFLKISALFSIFQVVFAANLSNGTADIQVVDTNIYGDYELKNLQLKLDLLQTMKDLHIKIDSLEMTFNKQRSELKEDLAEIKTAQKESMESINSIKANLIEIRGELHQQLKIQKNELKKDLAEVKAALTNQKESIKSTDSERANLTDISSALNEPTTTQKNKLLKDLEELKATTISPLPETCSEALSKSGRNGIYKIEVPHSEFEPFNVYCLKETADISEKHIYNTGFAKNTSAWLVIQRRQDGTIDFNRNWTDYQQGFGNLEDEFFIGLDKLHALTETTLHELWIQMEDFEGIKSWAKYSNFGIGGENELYSLNRLGNYRGDARDSLRYHVGNKWSTFDRDNDGSIKENCAQHFKGAWWHNDCYSSNLNGVYLRDAYAKGLRGQGIVWEKWYGTKPLKYVHMAIRPVQ